MAGKSVDIGALIAQGSVDVSRGEREDERKGRLLREDREHRHDLAKGWILFVLVVLSYVCMLGLVVTVLYLNGFTANTEQAKIAWAALTTLVTGLLSHMAGLMIGSRRK